jgi:hypothetical protein
VDEHVVEVGSGALHVAVVDGVALGGEGLTGRLRVGSGVLSEDQDESLFHGAIIASCGSDRKALSSIPFTRTLVEGGSRAMRKTGIVLIGVGVFAFFFAGSELEKAPPVPDGASLEQTLRHPAGRWEIARFAAAGAAGIGVLLSLFPKGR